MKHDGLFDFMQKIDFMVKEYILHSEFLTSVNNDILHRALIQYFLRPSKCLRPALLMLAYGCLSENQDLEICLPAAAGVEVFHTSTLVHDDIIDNSDTRRGDKSIHQYVAGIAASEMNKDGETGREFGRNMAILTGDIQQTWAAELFTRLAESGCIDPGLVIYLIKELTFSTVKEVLYGQALDLLPSFGEEGLSEFMQDERCVMDIYRAKTGVLFGFSAKAGALLGINSLEPNNTEVAAIHDFALLCGIAFQMQDDILGVTGQEKILGKSVYSDISEGKKTLILLETCRNASPSQLAFISRVAGNREAKMADIDKVREMMHDLNGIKYSSNIAKHYLGQAFETLSDVRDSECKKMLSQWGKYILDRFN